MMIRAFMVLVLLSSNISYASLFGDSEARGQIDALRTQISTMEARIAKMEQTLGSQGLLDLYSKVETLEQELGKLNGQIEMLVNENTMLQKRQRDFYIDLDNRLRLIEQPGNKKNATISTESVNTPGSTIASPSASEITGESPAIPENIVAHAAPDSATTSSSEYAATIAGQDENSAYKDAYGLFQNGDYATAIARFEKFLGNHPQSNLAPAAAYWIGNARYAMRDYQLAIDAQKRLISSYPNSNKVPDAYLNIASSLYELGDSKTSKITLENLLTKYPSSDAAKKAKQRLANLK